jgi:hypothetical protein
MSGLPLYGVKETLLSPEPQAAVEGLVHALADDVQGGAVVGARLRDVVAAHPTFLDGWAHLAEWALDAGDPVAAYAFARTGYHRGLDRVRKAGWGGQGPVPWRHEPNRGFLRSVHALMLAAALIGERDEAERCRDFLLQLDPDDALTVREVVLD